jgi:hypothetical protein
VRGRLINRFLADIARLHTIETAADPDGAGPITSGYDNDFQEPIAIDVDDADPVTNVRQTTRKEFDIIQVPCQVEAALFERLQQWSAGRVPDSRINLVFHFCDLEELDLVEADGNAKIKVNDRLVRLRRICGDEAVEQPMPPGGLYAIHVVPTAFGIGLRRNLLIATFDDREQSGRVA